MRGPRTSPEEAAAAPEERLGWLQYRAAMDMIDAERVQRGLPNLQVKAAAPLAEAKQAVTAALAARYPRLVPRVLRHRPERHDPPARRDADDRVGLSPLGPSDIRGLQQYLAARDQMVKILDTRPNKTMTAAANADLAEAWQTITGVLVEQNLAFAATYYRFLEHDQLAA